jgi:hypothetical protein
MLREIFIQDRSTVKGWQSEEDKKIGGSKFLNALAVCGSKAGREGP